LHLNEKTRRKISKEPVHRGALQKSLMGRCAYYRVPLLSGSAYNSGHLKGAAMRASPQDEQQGRPDEPFAAEGRAHLEASLYKELHKLAAHKMRDERANHTLQPTALVNEAYLRLADASGSLWRDRGHFLATAAHVMRHILVDHARSRGAGKRGGGVVQVTLDENLFPSASHSIDILALHEALERLSQLDARQGSIVELHFFGGLSFEEIASVLGMSERTVKRDWALARIWLFKEISG
jgi:RNA polymerase sigma-70 factor (ECF subfamily)